ncbi:MAG: hypothetical protein ACLUFN_09845 [Eubacterium sp.]
MIKKRIKNGELIDYEFVNDYNNIGACLLLYFNSPPFIRPVRPHKYSEYFDILADWDNKHSKRNH